MWFDASRTEAGKRRSRFPTRAYRPRVELLETRETPAFTALGFGSTLADSGNAIATDSAGNIYIAGSFQGTIDFDPGSGATNLTSAGSYDIFVAKYTAAGANVWAKAMGGPGSEDNTFSLGMALDASNNVYLTGRFSATADFDPGPSVFNLTSAGGTDIFVTKLDSGGNFVWADRMGGPLDDAASGGLNSSGTNGIAVDTLGNIFFTGVFQGTADFDPGPGTFNLSSGAGDNIFISKLDSAGNLSWAGALRGSAALNGGGAGVVVDNAGNVYAAGSFAGTTDFDFGPGTFNKSSFGSTDVFVAKFDTNGNFLWADQLGGTSIDACYSIALDGAGNIYAAGGFFSAPADFDPGPGTFNLSSAGSQDISIVKLDTNGSLLWAKLIGGSNLEVGFGITFDAASNVYFTGFFAGTVDFDPGAGTFNMTAVGGDDIFVCELDSAGNFVTASQMGGTGADRGYGVALDSTGRIYVVGRFSATADFAPGPGTFNLTSAGSSDIFLAQLPAVIVNDTGSSTTVVEGSTTDTYTVVLDWPPSADVVVTLTPDSQLSLSATTLTFTTANWNVVQTVTITAVDDAVLEGDHTGVLSYSASSADGRYNALTAASVSASLIDNDPSNLQTVQTFNLNGDYVAAGVGLRGQTSGTLALAGIPAGSTVTAAYLHWHYFNTFEAASFGNLTFAGTPFVGTLVGAHVLQTNRGYTYRADVTSLVSGNGSYLVTNVATGGAILADGASLVVVYTNPLLASRTIVLMDGGNSISPLTTTHTLAISGFVAPARVNAKTTFIVGGADVGTEAVSFTGGAGTLTLDNSFNRSSGSKLDVDTYDVSSLVPAGATSVSATVSYLVDEFAWFAQVFSVGPAGITITQSGGSTDVAETGPTSDTYTAILQSPPSANVIITLSPDTQVTVAPTRLTFTPANWFTPQTVTVTAVDDLITEGAHTGTITQTVTSADTVYNGLPLAAVTASITDNDNVGITVTESGGSTSVTEGAAGDSYTVVLTLAPVANVIVTLNPNAQLSTAPTRLTFTTANWSTSQTVSVTAVDDFLTEGPHSGVITHTVTSGDPRYNGFSLANITASIIDNDTAGITLNQSGGSTNITEGAATDSYTLVLNTAPTANVLITFSPDAQVSVPTALTFTSANWNVAQTVTVTAVDDALFEGPHTGVIAHNVTSADLNYNGQPVASVTAQITDNDAIGIVQSGGSTDVSEAGLTDSYTLVLRSMPTANVVITLSPDSQVTVAPTTLTFLPATWNVPLTVTVSAVDDLVAEGLHPGVVTHVSSSSDANYNAIATPSVTANISDNDIAALTLSPSSLALSEGGSSSTFVVVLTSQPTANVVVNLAPDAQLATASSAHTFTAVNWNVPQNVTLSAVNDLLAEGLHNGVVTLTASGAPGYSGLVSTLTASITDDDIPGVTLSTSSLSVLEGNVRSYSAVLTLPPTAPVTLNLNTGSLLSASFNVYTFTPANWNVPQAVVVTAIDDALVQGNHAGTITHSAVSTDPAYNGLAVADLTVNIIDNEGTVINGTANPDTILVTNSADLSTVFVKLNGKTTAYPSAPLVINTFGGADSVQIFDPRMPIVIVGGQLADKVTITGQKTGNTFTLDDAALSVNGVSLQLFEVESVLAAGSTVDDSFTVSNEPTFNVLFRGDQGTDLVQASDRPNTWRINNPASGTLNNIIAFTGAENLTGGLSSDGFYFNAGRMIPGVIDGGGGSNTLDYSLYTTPVTVNLQASLATAVRGFQNIDTFVGGKSSADRLIGLDQANTWTIAEQNAGTVGSVSFRGLENLVGGQLDDDFRLGDNRGLKGRIDGGGGTDTLDYSSYLSRAVAINLQSRLATNLAGFVNIESFVGGAGKDTLFGASQTNQWNISATNAGDVNGVPFVGFENLTGGGKSDTFNVALSAFWTGLLDGGAGADFLNGLGIVATGPTSGTLAGHPYRNIERRS